MKLLKKTKPDNLGISQNRLSTTKIIKTRFITYRQLALSLLLALTASTVTLEIQAGGWGTGGALIGGMALGGLVASAAGGSGNTTVVYSSGYPYGYYDYGYNSPYWEPFDDYGYYGGSYGPYWNNYANGWRHNRNWRRNHVHHVHHYHNGYRHNRRGHRH